MVEDSFSENEIQHILKLYKQRKEKNKEKYEKIKDTEEFKLKNRERAKEHYHKNKEMKRDNYIKNQELIKARNSFYYYKKRDRINDFKDKYPERYTMLVNLKYITENL